MSNQFKPVSLPKPCAAVVCVAEKNFYALGVATKKSRDRVTFPVSVARSTLDVIDEVQRTAGVNRTELTARLYEWFARQPRSVRRAVLDPDDDVGAVFRGLATLGPDHLTGRAAIETAVDMLRGVQVLLENVEDAARAAPMPLTSTKASPLAKRGG